MTLQEHFPVLTVNWSCQPAA